jgi:hypothetical protein
MADPQPLHRYAVIAQANEWRVLSGRAQIGRFQTRAEALAVALGLAKQIAAAGHGIELLAQDTASDFHLVSIYRFEPPDD